MGNFPAVIAEGTPAPHTPFTIDRVPTVVPITSLSIRVSVVGATNNGLTAAAQDVSVPEDALKK
jgi:hypothetical protein